MIFWHLLVWKICPFLYILFTWWRTVMDFHVVSKLCTCKVNSTLLDLFH
jgi:hypothetical protein